MSIIIGRTIVAEPQALSRQRFAVSQKASCGPTLAATWGIAVCYMNRVGGWAHVVFSSREVRTEKSAPTEQEGRGIRNGTWQKPPTGTSLTEPGGNTLHEHLVRCRQEHEDEGGWGPEEVGRAEMTRPL